MKAVTYHGKRDVRVDTVPDPAIEESTDAIVRITSTGICGSDLHLYEVLGPFMDEGDILGHEPMGVVEAVGSEVTQIKPGDRVVIPFNISCGHCFMCDQELYSQCETTQVRDQGKGASLLGYTKLYGQVPGGQAELLRVPQAHFGPIKIPEGPPDERFVYLSDVLPTAWQAVEYAAIRATAPWPCSASARSARCRAGSRYIAERTKCSESTSSPSGSRWPRRHGVHVIDAREHDDIADALRSLTEDRGPDSVIDAVGMEAHGAPLGKLAQQLASILPDARGGEDDREGGRRPAERAARLDRHCPPRRNDLAQWRLRWRDRSDADDGPVR